MARVFVIGSALDRILKKIAGDRIERINEVREKCIDLIVINSIDERIGEMVKILDEHSLILANIDLKDILKGLGGSKGRLITYGFNGKACVTASSVTENEIQVCIQRGVKNVEGEMIEEQEFSVEKERDTDVYDILGAVSAAVLIGMNVFEIRKICSKTFFSE